jgi:hypothetical protein
MVGSLITLVILGAQGPTPSDAVPWLELQHKDVKTTSASLLTEAAPEASPIFDQVMMGDIRLAMFDEMTRFANEILPEGQTFDYAGGGDDVGGLAFICGLLGFFPGFGIGHLVAGSISGFILFLIIDIVIAGVFFIVFPVVLFPFWYLVSLIVIVVERVVEAFSAANAAYRYHGYHGAYYGESGDVPAGGAFGSLPQAKPAFTIWNF